MRGRDFGAILAAFLSIRLVQNSTSRWIVSLELAFYTEFSSHHHYPVHEGNKDKREEEREVELATPIAVDMDNDGVVDVLVVPIPPVGQQAMSDSKSKNRTETPEGGGLRSVDLTPLRKAGGAASLTPLFPNVKDLFRRRQDDDVVGGSSSVVVSLSQGYLDVGGTAGGGDPTSHIVAVWSDGCVTLHVAKTLEQVWMSRSIHEMGGPDLTPPLDFHELSSIVAPSFGKHGAVIVAYSLTNSKGTDRRRQSSGIPSKPEVLALNAKTGHVVWRHSSTGLVPRVSGNGRKGANGGNNQTSREKEQVAAELKAQAHRHARADPRKIGILREFSKFLPEAEECFVHFRSSVMEPSHGIFPHYVRFRDDTNLRLAHFDRRRPSHRPNPQQTASTNKRAQTRTGGVTPPESKTKRFLSDGGHDTTANVVVLRGRQGLEALALRSGQPVCHLSLVESQYYADLNGDGTLDEVRFLSDESEAAMDATLIKELLGVTMEDERPSKGMPPLSAAVPCHFLAMSGIPARERLFYGQLCKSRNNGRRYQYDSDWRSRGKELFSGVTFSKPLLLGENALLVMSVSTGVATAYSVNGGSMTWQVFDGIPGWSEGSGEKSAFLGSMNSKSFSSSALVDRPIFMSGEGKLVVLAPSDGRILAGVTFPQQAVAQPALVDVNGDGTTDVLIMSTDAVWGYTVGVQGGTTFLSIVLGILLVGVVAVTLLTKIGSRSEFDLRSTDFHF